MSSFSWAFWLVGGGGGAGNTVFYFIFTPIDRWRGLGRSVESMGPARPTQCKLSVARPHTRVPMKLTTFGFSSFSYLLHRTNVQGLYIPPPPRVGSVLTNCPVPVLVLTGCVLCCRCGDSAVQVQSLLLVLPAPLCCDWTMGSIPLIHSLSGTAG